MPKTIDNQILRDISTGSLGAGKGEMNTANAPATDVPGGISIPISQLPSAVAGDIVSLEVVSVTDTSVNLRVSGAGTAPAETPTVPAL